MRFSDLKKKFPSLRVSVLVIAAFALLGSMMVPSIGEKMGLKEGLCVAYGDYDYGDYNEEVWSEDMALENYNECMEDCRNDYVYRLSFIDQYCREQYPDDDKRYMSCYLAWEGIVEYVREIEENMCEEWLEYPDTPPWERP